MEPEDIDALLDEANRLLESGKPDESLQRLDQIQEAALDSDDRIEWASLRAWALTEMGRDDEALEMLDSLLEDFPKSARLLSALGVVLSNVEELEDAREALEEAVSLSPSDEVSLANLALVYEKMRDYDRALTLYEQALNLGADVDWILLRMASALTERGRYDDAKVTLKRYLSLVPEDASQWIALGILHSDDEDFNEAFECYSRAEQIDPNSVSLRLNWGVSAVRARRLQDARRQLKYLQDLDPRSTRPWLLGAFILEEEGDLHGARSVYDRVLNRPAATDFAELTYALEMAMDFFARHKMRTRCERLFARAYAVNACTVELCEAHREVTGAYLDAAYWFSVMVEADYRAGLAEVREGRDDGRRFTRFMRDYQIVARDRDEAVSNVLEFARRMGESNPCVREFIGEEKVERTFTGIYEVETEALVFAGNEAE